MTTNTSMTAKAPSEISQIDRLAAEAQMYAMNARLNLFNLARVSAKPRRSFPTENGASGSNRTPEWKCGRRSR